MEKKSPSKNPLFWIRDPSIHVEDLMKEIESRLKLRKLDREELDRIIRLRFAPDSPAGFREFDPSHTANLFERGISSPKFTNPRLWWIKGPIKSAITWLTDFFALLDKKLSQNRVTAFYQVLHELIYLRKRIRHLESILETTQKEEFLWDEVLYEKYGWKSLSNYISQWIENGQSVCVIHPGTCELSRCLQLDQKNLYVHTTELQEREKLNQFKIPFESIVPMELLSMELNDFPFVLIGTALEKFSAPYLEYLFDHLSQNMSPTTIGMAYFSIQDSETDSPFQTQNKSKIEPEKFISYLQGKGFLHSKMITVDDSLFQLVLFSSRSLSFPSGLKTSST